MDFEERERRRRRQLVKVLIAEAGMACSIVAIVVVATLVAMGFFVSKDGTIEQSGLLQLHSMPTGGTVELDGSTLFSRTNLSRTLPAGEHNIKITRAGYDSWQKTVKMYSGMLIRLHYPRLFLQNRQSEQALRFGEQLAIYSVSTDRNNILYATPNSPIWQLINIRNDELKTTSLDLATILPGVVDGKFNGRVENLVWSKNSEHVLIKVRTEDHAEWILLDLRNLDNSLNLTKTFALDFQQIEMLDDTAGQLFALEKGNFRKINTNDRTISRVLLEGVESFASEGANAIYVMNRTENEKKVRTVGVYRDGERGGTTLATVAPEQKVRVALSRYYDEDYMIFTLGNELTIYYGAVPTYRENATETDFSGLKTLVQNLKLAEVPDKLSMSPDDEYLVAQKGTNLMVVDLDMGDLFEYDARTANLNWLDSSMLMVVIDKKLQVWDFDFTNQRTLVQTVAKTGENAEKPAGVTEITATLADYPAVIATNNKWLYYVVHSSDSLVLMREKIRE